MNDIPISMDICLAEYGRKNGADFMGLIRNALEDTSRLVPEMPRGVSVLMGFGVPFSRYYPEKSSIVTFFPPLFLKPYYGKEERDSSVKYTLTHEFTEPMLFKPDAWIRLKNSVFDVVIPAFENTALVQDDLQPSKDDVYLHCKAVCRDVIVDRMIIDSTPTGAEGFIISQSQQYGKARHFINSMSAKSPHGFESAYDIVSNVLSSARRAVIASEIKERCRRKNRCANATYRICRLPCIFFEDAGLNP